MTHTPLASRLSRAILAGRRWVVIAMLLALHFALIADPDTVFQRLWLLVHLGLFLVWQPFFAADREIDTGAVLILLAVVSLLVVFAAGWPLVMWLVLLLGIFGGRVFTVQAARGSRFYLVAFGYTLTVLLVWAVPAFVLGGNEVPEPVADFATNLLPFVLVLLAILPFPPNEERGQVFDFFYAVLVFQLGIVLVLGSLVMMRYTDDDYVESLGATVMLFGALLFVFAVLWNPMRGFGGLRTYLSAYLMSVGMPFELWMRHVAELAQTESDPGLFLKESLRQIGEFPWMRGGEWKSPDGDGKFGEAGEHATRFSYGPLEVVFYTGIRLSPALFLHMRLLAQVVGEFYEGKRRETALRRNAYLQAVHETGARLTHDVKNLLQSLYALMSMAPKGAAADGYTGLLQRQLPQITHRLQAALEKLRSPEVPTRELSSLASSWWAEVERRMASSDIVIFASIPVDREVPTNLFETFIENTVENARAKREREPGLAISLDLECGERGARLRLCDTGSAVPPAVVAKLFQQPVERTTGLGIGLYHVARQAPLAGYRLVLADNRDGCVSFVLEPEDSILDVG